jgi:hypothetical protein
MVPSAMTLYGRHIGFQDGHHEVHPKTFFCDNFGSITDTNIMQVVIEDLHVTSSMTLPSVAAMLEVFFLRRTGRFNGNNVRKRPKIGHFSVPIETFQCIKSNRNFDIKIWKDLFIYLHLDFLGN